MKVKKFLAVLAAASAVLFGQTAISEAHAVTVNEPAFTFWQVSMSEKHAIFGTQKPEFTFASGKFSIDLAANIKYFCWRCGKEIVVPEGVKPGEYDSSVCPGAENGSEGEKIARSMFGNKHIWHGAGMVKG